METTHATPAAAVPPAESPEPPPASDYERVERAIRYLETHARSQPRIPEVAAAAGLSLYHFERLFKRWAGVTPKRFLQYLTLDHAKSLLAGSEDLLSATWESGLSAPSRLHDLFVTCEGVTPGEFRRAGRGVRIAHDRMPTPFGEALLAATPRGLCGLSFLDAGGGAGNEALARLAAAWPGAELAADAAVCAPWRERLESALAGEATGEPFHLHLSGTNLQLRVWRALLGIPAGRALAYSDVARLAGRPTAVRAVTGAVGANPVAWLIPCHRVIRKGGELGGYRWGTARKRAMLAREAALGG